MWPSSWACADPSAETRSSTVAWASPSKCLPPVGDRALLVDLLGCAGISMAICIASDQLRFMTVAVALVLMGRWIAWRALSPKEHGMTANAELAFLVVCTIVGASNDWNSVVRHRIYDYDVPAELPAFSTIPLWMLLYWRLIVRTMASLARWWRLSPRAHDDDAIRLPGGLRTSGAVKISIEVLLVVVTRQCIYHWYLDPVWSWLPFAAALAVYAALFPRRPADFVLAAIVLSVGPAIEIAYIHVGELHHYHLGWLAGVPLWIALWWVLAAWVWSDIAPRLQRMLVTATRGPHPCAGIPAI